MKVTPTFGISGLITLVMICEVAFSSTRTSEIIPPCPKPATIKDSFSCLEVTRLLSTCDRCLDSRQALKKTMAKRATNANDFVKLMRGHPCNGTEYNCGNTRSYVTEIFEGLSAQFEESKYDDETVAGGQKSQNLPYMGDTLKQLFERQANKANTIIYHLRHTGTHDHVWAIEQLPRGQGYRVYQSYHDGYSLLAWLTEDDPDLLFEADHGEIMIWRTVQAQAENFIKKLSNGTASLNNTAALKDNPMVAPLLPYVDYMANYNKEEALNNFKRSWNKYGQGKILNKSEFMGDNSSYLGKLADIVGYFYGHGLNDSSPYPQDVWDKWIDLHGSPDPLYFPGLPNNALAKNIVPGKTYRFEVKSVEISGQPKCAQNARVMVGE